MASNDEVLANLVRSRREGFCSAAGATLAVPTVTHYAA